MQSIPPWPDPASASASYCQAVNGWTITLPVVNQTYAVWSSDTVFCLTGTSHLWQLMLYLALAGWVFLTAISLLQTYEWRGLSGYSLGELVKTVGRQIGLLVVAVCSFALLLQVHEGNYLLINSLLGNLPNQLVDSLWGRLDTLLAVSEFAVQKLDPNAWIDGLFGGNLPDNSAPFGLTWGQIFGGLGTLEGFLLSALIPARFVALFVAVVTAPLAILASSVPFLRRFFWTWLEFWLEIEALATGSAFVLAAYQELAPALLATPNLLTCGSNCGLHPLEQALILLCFAGLVCGANFYFLWRILGAFLTNITAMYQQQYQRERQFWGVLAQAAVGIVGALATAFTGGAALPAALAAEGLVSGVTNLGATPGGGVPGAGVGQAFIGAGRASATYQHQQAQEALRATRNQLQDDHYQAGQARQQRQDADRTVDRAIAKGYASQYPPRPEDGGSQNGGNPGPGAGAPPRPPGGGSNGGYGGNAPWSGAAPHQPPNSYRGSAPYGTPAPYAQTNGAQQASQWGSPPPARPLTVPQEISGLLGQAPIQWEIKRDIASALHALHTAHGQAAFDDGVRRVNTYLAAAQTQPHLRSGSLIDILRQLAQPADQEGENDV